MCVCVCVYIQYMCVCACVQSELTYVGFCFVFKVFVYKMIYIIKNSVFCLT